MTIIRITNLRVKTIIGIHPHERKKKTKLIVNVTLDYDASKAATSDSINDAINYSTLNKSIISLIEKSNYFLIERLASVILELIMKDKRVRQANVRVDKPKILKHADSVSVEMSAKR